MKDPTSHTPLFQEFAAHVSHTMIRSCTHSAKAYHVQRLYSGIETIAIFCQVRFLILIDFHFENMEEVAAAVCVTGDNNCYAVLSCDMAVQHNLYTECHQMCIIQMTHQRIDTAELPAIM